MNYHSNNSGMRTGKKKEENALKKPFQNGSRKTRRKSPLPVFQCRGQGRMLPQRVAVLVQRDCQMSCPAQTDIRLTCPITHPD